MYYALRLNPGNALFVIKFINVKYIHADKIGAIMLIKGR